MIAKVGNIITDAIKDNNNLSETCISFYFASKNILLSIISMLSVFFTIISFSLSQTNKNQ